MILFILRGAFLLLTAAVITLYVNTEFQESTRLGYGQMASILAGSLCVVGLIIFLDATTKTKRLSAISGVFLGLLAGLLAAYALSFVVDLVGVYAAPDQEPARTAFLNLLRGVKVLIGLITCYIGISLVLQTKDDFRFVIPYVEFAKEIRGNRPTLIDTSAVIDGRILDLAGTRLIQNALIVHQSVIDELQTLADSGDAMKRSRGRRGLDILQALRDAPAVEVRIDDTEASGPDVDHKLIDLAAHLQARVMTTDLNLNKVATLRGIDVINLNEIARVMKPVVLPGQLLEVEPVKPGESEGQGVGYLDDGTMVVIEGGRDHLRRTIPVTVTSTLQTNAGRMIFASVDASTLKRQPRTQPRTPTPSMHDTAIEEVPPAAAEPERPGRGNRNPRRRR